MKTVRFQISFHVLNITQNNNGQVYNVHQNDHFPTHNIIKGEWFDKDCLIETF